MTFLTRSSGGIKRSACCGRASLHAGERTFLTVLAVARYRNRGLWIELGSRPYHRHRQFQIRLAIAIMKDRLLRDNAFSVHADAVPGIHVAIVLREVA